MLGPQWAAPWWWLLCGPILLMALRRGRRRAAFRFSATALLEVPATPSPRQCLLWLPDALRLVACALLVAALARPQTPEPDSAIHDPGLAIMVCIDTSGSMGAVEAASPSGPLTRLDQVKRFLDRFLDERRDSVGLIAFAASPRVVCPPTTDHAALRSLAAGLVVDRLDNRTNIGDALVLAAGQLRQTPAAERLVLLATDGAHNVSTAVGVGEAARILEALSIRVHAIGVGAASAVAPLFPPRDDAALRIVADWTGGRYFRATNLKEIEHLAAALAETTAFPMRLQGYGRHRDWFPELIAAALLVLALERLLASTWLKVTPE